jgi:hypothetical protein
MSYGMIIFIVWAIGALASLGLFFIIRHEFSPEGIKKPPIITSIISSLILSWIYFIMEVACVLVMWEMYGRYME